MHVSARFGRLFKREGKPHGIYKVSFTQAPDYSSECEIPDWADFSKSGRDKVEAQRALQRGRSGRPAEQLPGYDQKFSTMTAIRNAQE
eukprot:2257888-Alexandrium_andersonii.AAC.1